MDETVVLRLELHDFRNFEAVEFRPSPEGLDGRARRQRRRQDRASSRRSCTRRRCSLSGALPARRSCAKEPSRPEFNATSWREVEEGRDRDRDRSRQARPCLAQRAAGARRPGLLEVLRHDAFHPRRPGARQRTVPPVVVTSSTKSWSGASPSRGRPRGAGTGTPAPQRARCASLAVASTRKQQRRSTSGTIGLTQIGDRLAILPGLSWSGSLSRSPRKRFRNPGRRGRAF